MARMMRQQDLNLKGVNEHLVTFRLSGAKSLEMISECLQRSQLSMKAGTRVSSAKT